MTLVIVILSILVAMLIYLYIREIKRLENRESQFQGELEDAREDAICRSRASLEGKIFEQITPYLPQWKYMPSDAKFIGMPIDYIVFDGMSNGQLEKLIIVEVKKGKGRASKIQRQIRKIIEDGKIEWELIKIE